MTTKRSPLALLVVMMLGELLTGCVNGPPPASATTAARPDPTPGGPADESAVAVYFVGTTPQGPRLYREFHRVSGDDPPRQALDLLARGASDDPDYRSLLPTLDVLALVNITSPTQGARVADRFAASGRSSSFEATTPWLVRDGARTVLRGSTTADGWVDRLYPWRAEVDVSSLAPGRYTFVAMTDDPSGGTEGKGPTQDTRTIVVS